jgi:hypothetical protein
MFKSTSKDPPVSASNSLHQRSDLALVHESVVPGRRNIALNDGLGPSAGGGGGIQDEDDMIVSGALGAAVDDDAGAVD